MLGVADLILPTITNLDSINDKDWRFKISCVNDAGSTMPRVQALGSYTKLSRIAKRESTIVFKIIFLINSVGELVFNRIVIPNESYKNNDVRLEAKEDLYEIFKDVIKKGKNNER